MSVTVGIKYERLSPMMSEKLKRRWAACEAMALGRGGIAAVSRETGISRTTIRKGVRELERRVVGEADDADERVREPGGGRRRLVAKDAGLERELRRLVESSTRGDPESPLLWTSKSVRKLADELSEHGRQVSYRTVARLLGGLGYSLQGNRKTKQGASHPDRDAQFEHINRKVKSFQRRRQPVISVDAKKKENLGEFRATGREWRRKRRPREVDVHDFLDDELGVAIPYGVYDPARNEGWVSVGVDHETPEFAVESIRRWWREMGSAAYPKAKQLLITADSGGSNRPNNRLWKLGLQEFGDETGLQVCVCHFPPGTSKWNKIEHRMFCHIAANWRGRPLVSRAVVVNLIGKASTAAGLRIKAALDTGSYPRGVKVDDDAFNAIRLRPDRFHGDWNYDITPR